MISTAGLVVATALTASPAQASIVQPATAPTVGLDCQAIGNSAYDCSAEVAGGVAPYGYLWSDGHTGASDANRCQSRTHATVTVTVTDSDGASASASDSFSCYGGPPA